QTKPFNERGIPVLEAADEVHDEVALAWREPHERRRAFMTARVAVAVDAEPDDARAPQHRRLAGDIPEQPTQGTGVVAASRVRDSVQERLDVGLRRLSLL